MSISSPKHQLSRIDLDIRQIRILSTMESMSYAKLTYEFGYNVETPRDSENDPFSLVSLQQLAVSTIRAQAVPYYTYFVEYFNEKNYADKRMRLVLDGQSKWTATAHKTEALVLTSAFQIVYMEVLFHLSDAVNKCDAIVAQGGSTFAVALETDRHPIDNIAALLIGSLEGSQEGGSFPEDGELVWNLANKRAFQFQTMNEEEFAIVNQELMNLLFAAKGEMDGLACSKLRTTTEKISRYMQVGLIQSIIHAAIESQDFESNSLHVSLAQGDVLTDSLLPIIVANAADPGELIKQNMIFQAGEDTVKDGAQAVADVLGFYMTSKAYIPCEHVGASGGVNPCAKSGSAARSVHAWTVFLIASTASLICVLLT